MRFKNLLVMVFRRFNLFPTPAASQGPSVLVSRPIVQACSIACSLLNLRTPICKRFLLIMNSTAKKLNALTIIQR